jgi:hypothetical protein
MLISNLESTMQKPKYPGSMDMGYEYIMVLKYIREVFLVKIFIVSVLVIGLLGLIGCSRPTEFKGESKTWSVTCSVDQSANVKTFQIRYIGQDSEPNSHYSYSFKDSKNFQGSGEGKGTLEKLRISGKSIKDTPYINEDSFTLYIKWNDKEESIRIVKG